MFHGYQFVYQILNHRDAFNNHVLVHETIVNLNFIYLMYLFNEPIHTFIKT